MSKNFEEARVSLGEMLEAGVHFGHQTKYWNPKMKGFLYGSRNKIHIINLDETIILLKDALKFAKQTIKNGGTILFVGTRIQASKIISAEATRAGMPYVSHRWLGGMLTNFETVKKSIKKYESKKSELEQNNSSKSKKELLKLDKEVKRLESSIGGIVDMHKLPTVLFIIDTGYHDIAIKEAKKLGIPVIGVVDTNNDPSVVDYIIPGNDDSAKAIQLYASLFADTIIEAKDNIVSEIASQSKVEMVEDISEAKQKTIRRIKKSVKDENEEDEQITEHEEE